MTKENKRTITLIVILALITVFRAGMMEKLPIWAIGSSPGDDGLMVTYARSIFYHSPLPYSRMALAKGQSYPLFLAVCSWLGLPYKFTLGMFFALAAFLTVLAVRPAIKNKYVLAFMYLFFLFSPAGFMLHVVQRVYRQSVVWPSVGIIFACLLAMWLRKNRPLKQLLPWSILCGVTLAFFWFIREDSIWILPFLAASILLYMIHAFMYHKEQLFKRTLIFAIPVVILAGTIGCVSRITYKNYGTHTINDRTHGSFAKFCGNLLKIESGVEENDPRIWLYRAALDKFAAINPEFAQLEELMYVWTPVQADGEIEGDLYHWELSSAATQLGHYNSAAESEAYFAGLNAELEEAFANGTVPKNNKIFISSQAKGFTPDEIPGYIKLSLKNFVSLLKYEHTGVEISRESSGTDEQIRTMEQFTASTAIYPQQKIYQTHGYLKVEDPDADYKIYLCSASSGEEITMIPLEKDSDKLYKFDFSFNKDKANDKYEIAVYENGTFVDRHPANEEANIGKTYIFAASESEKTENTGMADFAQNDGTLSNLICALYSKTGLLLAVLALIGFILMLIVTAKELKVKKYDTWNIVIFLLGVMLIMAALIFANSLFNEFLIYMDNSNTRFIFYTVPAFYFIELIEFLSIYFGIVSIKKLINK